LPITNSAPQTTRNDARSSLSLKKGESDATVVPTAITQYSILGPIFGGILGASYIALFLIDKYYLIDVLGLDVFLFFAFCLMIFFQFGFGILNSQHSRTKMYYVWTGVALGIIACFLGVFAGIYLMDRVLGYFVLLPLTALVWISTRVKYTKIGLERIANRESWKVYDHPAHSQDAGEGLVFTASLLRDYTYLSVWMFIKTFCLIVFIATPVFAIIGILFC
jgi:hypothetical protein